MLQEICDGDIEKIYKDCDKLTRKGHNYYDIMQELYNYFKNLPVTQSHIVTIHELSITLKKQVKLLEILGNTILIYNKGMENKIHFVNCMNLLCYFISKEM